MKTVLLLLVSNVFMTAAWYGHLKALSGRPLWVAMAVLYMGVPLRLNYLWATLCLVGAGYFSFRPAA